MPVHSRPQVYAAPIVTLRHGSKSFYDLNVDELDRILKNSNVINKEIVLVSIAGAFRKGKSFMLNLFVAYLEWLTNGEEGEWLHEDTRMNSFEYKTGADAHTKGILLWSKPYILKGQEGKEYAVFLMDTQGAFDHTSSVKNCASIFAMSTLLSSVQIFNVDKQIQEDNLDNLRLFSEYAQLVKESSSETPFQKLLFLIRDWPYSGQYPNGFQGGQQYLKDTLKIREDLPEENRAVRENLPKSYESLEAFLMPHPGMAVASNNSKDYLGKIEEDFGAELKNFIPSLFSRANLTSKKINGHPVTCGQLAELVTKYLPIFNSDKLPEPKTIRDATVDAVDRAAAQTGKDEYDREMAGQMEENPNITDLVVLQAMHICAVKMAMEKYGARPKMGENSGSRHKEDLQRYFELRYEGYKRTVKLNIQMEGERRRYAEEHRRLVAAQEAERIRREEVEEALRQQREDKESAKRRYREEMNRQNGEMERNRQELERVMAEQSEQSERMTAELVEMLEKQGAEIREMKERYGKEEKEQEAKIAEADAKLREKREVEEKKEQERRRFEEERVAQPLIVGGFCDVGGIYGCISNVEVLNRTRYYFKHRKTAMDKGVPNQPPTDFGPGDIHRFGCHKFNWSTYGCAGSITWEYTVDNTAYEMTLSFITIYKTIFCYESNSVGLTLTTGKRSTTSGIKVGSANLKNHLISVTATTGDSNHAIIRVTISEVDS